MSSDSRRTGGGANRGWCDGTPLPLLRPDRAYLAAQVDLYLADCIVYGLTPSVAMALKVIYAPDDAHKRIVRDELAAQASRG